jgi:uncharacterized membrane protein
MCLKGRNATEKLPATVLVIVLAPLFLNNKRPRIAQVVWLFCVWPCELLAIPIIIVGLEPLYYSITVVPMRFYCMEIRALEQKPPLPA